jgi:hypothetical protein
MRHDYGFSFSIAIADWGGGFQTLETWAAGENNDPANSLSLSFFWLVSGVRSSKDLALRQKSKEGC